MGYNSYILKKKRCTLLTYQYTRILQGTGLVISLGSSFVSAIDLGKTLLLPGSWFPCLQIIELR